MAVHGCAWLCTPPHGCAHLVHDFASLCVTACSPQAWCPALHHHTWLCTLSTRFFPMLHAQCTAFVQDFARCCTAVHHYTRLFMLSACLVHSLCTVLHHARFCPLSARFVGQLCTALHDCARLFMLAHNCACVALTLHILAAWFCTAVHDCLCSVHDFAPLCTLVHGWHVPRARCPQLCTTAPHICAWLRTLPARFAHPLHATLHGCPRATRFHTLLCSCAQRRCMIASSCARCAHASSAHSCAQTCKATSTTAHPVPQLVQALRTPCTPFAHTSAPLHAPCNANLLVGAHPCASSVHTLHASSLLSSRSCTAPGAAALLQPAATLPAPPPARCARCCAAVHFLSAPFCTPSHACTRLMQRFCTSTRCSACSMHAHT